MKNFSKTLISMAAVMAVGSAMAVSAFASMSASYKDGTLTVTGASTHGDKQTIMLVAGADATKTAELDEYVATGGENGTIKHINQEDTANFVFDGGINVQALAEGNYKLMISGSDGKVESYKFTVSNTPLVKYEEIIIGDVNGDGFANSSDATCIIYLDTYMDEDYGKDIGQTGNQRTPKDGDKPVIIGDVNGDGFANSSDATCIIYLDTYMDEDYGKDVGQTGNSVWVVKK